MFKKLSGLLSNTGGFSLIELMIVIAIIGVLANIALLGVGTVLSKARDSKRKADLQALNTAVAQYFADKGTYVMPGTGASGWGLGGNINQGNGAVVPGTVAYPGPPITAFLQQLGYLNTAPVCDPLDTRPCDANYLLNYYYCVCNDGTRYSLSVTLEKPTPSDLSHTQRACGASSGPLSDAAGWLVIDAAPKNKNYAFP